MGFAINRMIDAMDKETVDRERRKLERMAGTVTETNIVRDDVRKSMGFSSYICNAIILFTTVTCLNYLYMFICNVSTEYFSYDSYVPWLIFSMVCYVLLSILLRRPRPVSFIVITLAVFLVSHCLVLLNHFGYYLDIGFALLAILLFAFTYLRIFFLTTRRINLKALNTNFEIAVVVLTAGAIYSSVIDMSYLYLYPLALAVALSLFAMITERSFDGRRTEGGRNGLRIVTLILSLLFMAASTMLAVLLAAKVPIKEAISTVGRWLAALGAWISSIWGKFLQWLAATFPSTEGPIYIPEESPYDGLFDTGTVTDAPVATGGNNAIFIGAMVVLLILLVGGTIVYMMKKRGATIGGYANSGSGKKRAAKRIPWVKRAVAAMRDKIVFVWRRTFRKNTLPGFYAWLEHKYRLRRKGRGEGETCRAFIRRVSRDTPAQAERFSAFADALDSLFFGDGSVTMSADEISALRTAITARK